MSDAAIVTVVSGVVTVATMLVGFLTLWVKLRYGADQAKKTKETVEQVQADLDDNTKITQEGTQAAADAATVAASKAEELAEQLDGKIEAKITRIVKAHTDPLLAMFRTHVQQNDANIGGIDAKFAQMSEYIHERNHDMLGALQVQANKIEALLAIMRQQNQQAERP